MRSPAVNDRPVRTLDPHLRHASAVQPAEQLPQSGRGVTDREPLQLNTLRIDDRDRQRLRRRVWVDVPARSEATADLVLSFG